MPRKLRAKTRNKPVRKKSNSEPLAEGIIVPLDKAGKRRWKFLNDEELVEYAKKFIEERGIKSKSGLLKEDSGLYKALWKRGLLDRLEFEEGRRKMRSWASMTDDEIVEHAKGVINEKRVKSGRGLYGEDSGLYAALRQRNLLDRLEFEKRRRDWASMIDDELVEHAKKVIEEKGIKNRKGVEKEDKGLYTVLLTRKLLDRLKFEKGQRDWASMSDDELVEHAKKFVKERGIKRRRELAGEDAGLYQTLRLRKLLDSVFASIEKNREKQAVQDVFDALREFGGPG